MALTLDTILQFIRSETAHPMRIQELAQAMKVSRREYPSFRRCVKKLIDEGRLVRLKRGRIGPADQMDIAVGTISVNRSGRGFLEIEGATEDIMILDTGLLTALDGDRVMVRLVGERFGRQTGVVIKVLERSGRNIVGILHKQNGLIFVRPDNPRIHRDIYVSPADSLKAKDGEKVVVKLTAWDDPHTNPCGKVTERLGYPNAPGVDMLTIIKSYNLPESFSAEIMNQAKKRPVLTQPGSNSAASTLQVSASTPLTRLMPRIMTTPFQYQKRREGIVWACTLLMSRSMFRRGRHSTLKLLSGAIRCICPVWSYPCFPKYCRTTSVHFVPTGDDWHTR